MLRIYEYTCEDHGCFESMSAEDYRHEPRPCPRCGKTSPYKVSSPTPKLEGISGDFPSAADKWAKDREVRSKQKSYWTE